MSKIVELYVDEIKSGNKTLSDVPRLLKEKVRLALISEGREDLTK